MVTRIRIRCPCCGSLPWQTRVESLDIIELEYFEQSFGGRIPRSEAEGYSKLHGTAGIMKYEKGTDQAQIEELKKLWLKRLKSAAKSLGSE